MSNRFSLSKQALESKKPIEEPEEKPVKTRSVKASEPAEKLKANAVIEESRKVPTVPKLVHIPVEIEYAIKELEKRQNLKRQLDKTTKLKTEQDITREAFELLFAQPGSYADCLKVAKEELKQLMEE